MARDTTGRVLENTQDELTWLVGELPEAKSGPTNSDAVKTEIGCLR
jgi:hypothetical protein